MRFYRIRKFPAKLTFLIFILALLAIKPTIVTGFKKIALEIASRPLSVFAGLRDRFTRIQRLRDENLELKQRLASFSVELARLKTLDSENQRLRELLDFKKNSHHKAIAANVVARDSIDWRGMVIIDKGSKHGIKRRMPCATTKGFVGSVMEVGHASSKVMLITDPNSRIGVTLEPSGESGVLVGSPEGLCRVLYLSLDGSAKKGERVFTSGFSAFFPGGLEIGRTSRVGLDETNLYKYAIVDPSEDLYKLGEVVCLDIRD